MKAEKVTHDPQLVEMALADLASKRCVCHRPKRQEQSFCNFCKAELPPAHREGLFLSVKSGYAEAYAEAKNYLQQLRLQKAA